MTHIDNIIYNHLEILPPFHTPIHRASHKLVELQHLLLQLYGPHRHIQQQEAQQTWHVRFFFVGTKEKGWGDQDILLKLQSASRDTRDQYINVCIYIYI